MEHADENCWNICNLIEGKCPWCGTEGWCCRKGRIGNGCDGSIGGNNQHQCVLKPGTGFEKGNTMCRMNNTHVNNLLNHKTTKSVPGWTIDCNEGVWIQENYAINKCSNWYGWNPSHPVGSISTILYGNGHAKLDFGNCEGGQNIRFVKVYLDGTEIDSAPNSTPSKSIEFDFTDDSVLKISEHTESILQFNSLEIICE